MRRRLILIAALMTAGTALAAPVEKKKGGGDSFIQLHSITANILLSDHRNGVLQVDVGLDVPDPALRKRAEESIPRLQDAFVREMATYVPSIPPGGAPNPDILSTQLQRAVDRVLGRPGARVLLGSMLVN
jgi:hypothetical protein